MGCVGSDNLRDPYPKLFQDSNEALAWHCGDGTHLYRAAFFGQSRNLIELSAGPVRVHVALRRLAVGQLHGRPGVAGSRCHVFRLLRDTNFALWWRF